MLAKYHKFLSYLLFINGTLALLLSDYLNLLLALSFVALLLAKAFNRINFRLSPIFWKAISLSMFLIFLTLLVISFLNILPALNPVDLGIYFLLYLKFNRIVNLESLKEYYHLYIISFLELLISSILSYDMLFGLYYITFFSLALVVFILHYILLEIGYSHKVYNNQEILLKRFFFKMLIFFVLLTFLINIVFFLFFPRIGFGYFFKDDKRKKLSLSLLSDNVQLGGKEEIEPSELVVLRVEMKEEEIRKYPSWDFYFRGAAFDYYDGSQWKSSFKNKFDNIYSAFELIRLSADCKLGKVRQDIFVEPLNSNLIFGLDKQICLEFKEILLRKLFSNRMILNKDKNGSFYFPQNITENRNYTIYSNLTDYFEEPLDKNIEANFLQLPPLSEKIMELSRSFLVKNSALKTAETIEAFLKKNFTYSLKTDFSDKPIEDFLFRFKSGYCTYFASTMIILLRSLGLPSRLVTGFHGGEWNELGNYLLLRHKDAHSWVELYLPEKGWKRFDPTPADRSGEGHSSGAMNFFQKYYDFIKLRWEKYVIFYDLADQRRFYNLFKTENFHFSHKISTQFDRIKNFFNSFRKPVIFASSRLELIFFLIFLFFLILLLLKNLSSLRFSFGNRRNYGILCKKITALLKQAGYQGKIPTFASFREIAVALPLEAIFKIPLLEIVEQYYACRYSNNCSPEVLKYLESKITALKKSFRAVKQETRPAVKKPQKLDF